MREGAKTTIGIDVGAETVKIVEAARGRDGRITFGRRSVRDHHKDPHGTLEQMLADFDLSAAAAAAVTGRMSRRVRLPRIPVKQAQSAAHGHLFGETPATVVSIGSHGFSVLEMRSSHVEMFRENSRCSQGTGNFLRQLVERFELSIDEASELSEGVRDPAPLSGRCPVILKTDMTHLANKGEPRRRIVAGLYDAVCENVQVLVKPRVSPPEVVLIGGVSRSARIREHFRRFTMRHGMRLVDIDRDDALCFEAVGCAVIAMEDEAPRPVPALADLFAPHEEHVLEELPALSRFLGRVRRMPPPPPPPEVRPAQELILGFDIGSTGSKVVAIECDGGRGVWQGYVNTSGAPVRAAQALMRQFVESAVGLNPVRAVGATGSGREIVGSLMSTCYGHESVFVLNEIAAHAEGALQCDPRVDTIFEIGGQDAKYIRLSEGRVVDAAMNEACSAGTGSFIEEQGRKFQGVDDVVQLGAEALAADRGVSLGQHCSVFMAEVIDEAVASGVPRATIVAGIYDSIIQNYLNRVKGSRSVGKVIFCQGMPFSSDALAAAVARQTGAEVIVPPNPGTVGALGIALLARKELGDQPGGIDPARFLAAEVVKKDVFVCKSTKGCGGAGNRCRIDRIRTLVQGVEQTFTWGGCCSLYDRGTGRSKLPDRAPDPFREREELLAGIRERLGERRGRPTVALTDEFVLKGMLPFFATFIRELGFDPMLFTGADQALLKRGIEDANVPFCAPLQQYHGCVSLMAEAGPDFLFLPFQRHLPRIKDEPWAQLCPLIQGSAEILRWDLGQTQGCKVVSPVINIGRGNLESRLLGDSLADLAAQLGADPALIDGAWRAAVEAQRDFDDACLELGRRALSFCAEHGITPIAVLGRSYTIHNTVLNSNVPAILREQGAIPIPMDCYPVDDDVPVFKHIFWGFGQRNLRAAHQIRRTPGIWSIYCSNYSCGPDSFNLHLYGYIMEGKPFAIIETDGHSGDAGTKTRIEAFLYCVREDRRRNVEIDEVRDLRQLHRHEESLDEIRDRDSTVLIPRMGAGAETLAACVRGVGIRAESLPLPDAEALALGRRHTSGKECIPMTLTLGSLLQRLKREPDGDRSFTFFMPTANGPCRFGSYSALHRMVLDRLGYEDRVRIWSPGDTDYFDGVPDGFAALVFAALCAADTLIGGLYHARPAEIRPGAATALFERYHGELIALCERSGRGRLTNADVMLQALSGQLFGISDLVRRAARGFARITDDRPLPTVLVVGEVYVRCDPFANDFVILKLERRGIRCRFAPFSEWLEYSDYQDTIKHTIPECAKSFLQAAIQHQVYRAAGDVLGWHRRTTVQDTLAAAAPYIRQQLSGEAALTLGAPLHEWREGEIDGAVSVGPLECMPNKICESQFFHVAEREGLLSLTLNLNGDPIDPEILDNFAYEVHAQWRRRRAGFSLPPPPMRPRQPPWRLQSRVNPREP